MPVAVAPNSVKSVRPGVSVRHDRGLVIVACHRVPQAAQPSATCPWKGPRATRGRMSWSVGTQWKLAAASALPRSLPCRARKLVALRVLPGRAMRHGMSSEMLFFGLPGKLLLPGSCAKGVILSLERPSRQAPLAGVLFLNLNTLFLNGSKGTRVGLGGRVASPATGRCYCPCTSRDTKVSLL